MSYRPNDPAIIHRSPQHGIRLAGSSKTSSLTGTHSSPSCATSSSSWTSMPFANTVTVNCAKAGCANTVTVVPHGYHHDRIHIHIKCKECYDPLVMEVKDVKENKVAETWDDEEWGGVRLVEEHVEGI